MRFFTGAFLALATGLGATSSGAITLDADADAWVEGMRFANSANGQASSLGASYDASSTRSFKIYIRFDLSAHIGEKINAVLSLTESFHYPHNMESVPYLVYALNDAGGDDWIEKGVDGVTYNTAPGNIPSDYFDMTAATMLGNWAVPIAPPAGTVHSFGSPALTSFLNNGLGDDGLVTLIILNEQCCYESFASREHMDFPDIDGPRYPGPRLSFEVSGDEPPTPSVPLPAALPLSVGAMGALGWIARRRSRK